MIDLSGRIVIVTGGNSGIGLGIAPGVARAGASVAIWSRRAERNAEAVAELEGLGATAIGAQCDVSNEDNVAAAMRETPDRYNDGTAPIEVSSGNRKVYRLSRRGNRRLNHAIHMAAVTQIRYRHSDGRAYYDKKIAEGKTPKEALRALSGRSATPSTST